MSKRSFSTPQPEVHAMIAQTFQDAFSPQWIKTHLTNPAQDLIILHHIIPWQPIIERLAPFYHPQKGRSGHSLRILVATSILCRLRQLSDRKVIENIQENRYMQYFCNVPDQRLMTFLNPSTLCRFRKRIGAEGTLIIEERVFEHLKRAAVIDADMMLMDTTVLESPIIYPTDIRLIYKAFDKMAALATEAQLDRWWDHAHLKQRWRAYHLNPKDRLAYLSEFYVVFVPAFERFAAHLAHLPQSPLRQRWSHLLAVLTILDEQTQQKLAGHRHIDHRLVSLDDLDARPIKKGKSHPSTEFGTTLQMTFNRQGFMITTDNFMGRSLDVDEAQQEACRKARSATEGFIAVAKHLRGFARSLYRGLQGAILWAQLGQCAYNLQKFLQLYRAEALEESTLIKLRL